MKKSGSNSVETFSLDQTLSKNFSTVEQKQFIENLGRVVRNISSLYWDGKNTPVLVVTVQKLQNSTRVDLSMIMICILSIDTLYLIQKKTLTKNFRGGERSKKLWVRRSFNTAKMFQIKNEFLQFLKRLHSKNDYLSVENVLDPAVEAILLKSGEKLLKHGCVKMSFGTKRES